MKESSCVNPKMVAYCQEVRKLEDKFHGLELNHVLRRYNEAADALAKAASNRSPEPPGVFARDLHEPSVKPAGEAPEVILDQAIDDDAGDCSFTLLEWIVQGKLPPDKAEARRIAQQAKLYRLIEGDLYRRSPSGIL